MTRSECPEFHAEAIEWLWKMSIQELKLTDKRMAAILDLTTASLDDDDLLHISFPYQFHYDRTQENMDRYGEAILAAIEAISDRVKPRGIVFIGPGAATQQPRPQEPTPDQ